MKPNFALILSMDGIALLQRSSPGWAIVGEAYPDGDDLTGDMARLRDAADRLAPGEATFKVVIPNDQIRFLSIPAGTPDPTARQKAVERALDGATPYALDELAVDHTVSGDTIHIAAVALETLQEADEFARGFGFDPLCFVAMPEDRDYLGEPFFGTAHDVPDDILVTPDTTAIRVTGHVRAQDPDPGPSLVGGPGAEAETPVAGATAAVDPIPDGDGDDAEGPVSFSTRRDRSSGDDKAASSQADRAASPRGDAPRITFAEPEVGKSPAPVVLPPREVQPEEMSASLQSDAGAPAPKASPLAGVMATAGALSARMTQAMAARRAARAETREAARTEAARKAEDAARRVPEAPTTAEGISNPAAPADSLSQQLTGEGALAASSGGKGRKSKGKSRNKAVAAATPPPPAQADAASPLEKVVANLHEVEGRIPGALTAEERRAEQDRMTVFGARGASYDTGSGGSAGLVIAAVLAVFVLGTAGWAMLFQDATLAALVGTPQSEEEGAATTSGELRDALVPPGPGEPEGAEEIAAPDPIPQPAAEQQVDTAPTPEDAAVAQALAEEEADQPAEPSATEPPAPSQEPVSPLIVTEAAEAPPETGSAPDATDGTLTPEEEARYAASGIWQESPEGIATTGDGATGTGADGSADPDAPPERSPEVELTALTPDRRPAPPAPPPIFGQRFDMDARGLVVATPEGAETPSGVLAYAGPPPVEPPARPGDPEPDPATAPEPAPQAAPQDDAAAAPDVTEEVLPQVEEAVPSLQFAGVRPRLRPVSEATQAQDDVQVAAQAAVEGALARAVEGNADAARPSVAAGLAGDDTEAAEGPEAEVEEAAAQLVPEFPALRPLQRPGNIGELAAAARATPIPTPSIAPSGPTSRSVAQQATLRKAINLREVNLIGVYGQPSDRRALVRLSNGRYRKVKVGDRLEGGRIVAIGDDTLRYQKNGRNMTLAMPNG